MRLLSVDDRNGTVAMVDQTAAGRTENGSAEGALASAADDGHVSVARGDD